jgi:Ca-activated chloride channel family protein
MELAGQAWYNLGNAYFDAEQWPQAFEAYKEALRLQPGDLDAKHNLELAIQELQEQQQQAQEQNQQQQDDQQQGAQDNQNEQRSEQTEASPTPGGEAASSSGQDGDEQATPQPAGQPQENQGMTEEQATQLLRALLSDSQTLQERFQEMHQVPGPAEQDW